MSKNKSSELSQRLSEIIVYGMQEKSYNSVMQGLDFNKTMSGMMDFINLRSELGAKTKIQVSYLEMEENKEDTGLFREFWESKVDAIEIWRSIIKAINLCLSDKEGINTKIDGVCLANQGESVLAWDSKTLEPVSQVLIWQDSRSANLCQERSKYTSLIRELTGLEARVFLHEFDHLIGVTFNQRVGETSLMLATEKRRKLLKKKSKTSS